MTTRSRRKEAIARGSEIATPTPIGRPAATGTVELTTIRSQTRRLALLEPYTAVEMTRPWKSQNDFHTRLEISHRTRDSHIPTAAALSLTVKKNKDANTNPQSYATLERR